jgi:hypothetical protein
VRLSPMARDARLRLLWSAEANGLNYGFMQAMVAS